jgi:hypothetical protein
MDRHLNGIGQQQPHRIGQSNRHPQLDSFPHSQSNCDSITDIFADFHDLFDTEWHSNRKRNADNHWQWNFNAIHVRLSFCAPDTFNNNNGHNDPVRLWNYNGNTDHNTHRIANGNCHRVCYRNRDHNRNRHWNDHNIRHNNGNRHSDSHRNGQSHTIRHGNG